MKDATTVALLTAILPTVGTILISIMSALTSRAIKAIDSKLARIEDKLDGHSDRLAKLEVRVENLEKRRR